VEPNPIKANGLAAFVKQACPTCAMIAPQLREVAAQSDSFQVVTQDDPRFPPQVAQLIDDRELGLSYLNNIEATPTLIRYENGREVERVMGWDRAAWRRLTGIAGLGEGLPATQPG
jgi:thiol-disulfide isomerase/thioredoxin